MNTTLEAVVELTLSSSTSEDLGFDHQPVVACKK